MTGAQKELINSVIVTLDSLTVTGAGNMGKVLGCIEALGRVLKEAEEAEHGGQDAQ